MSTEPTTGRADAATPSELTARAVGAGVFFGLLFGAANAYLGLRVGMTVSTSIPVAIMTVTLIKVTGARASLLETNLAQTVGSASTSLATGAIFTLPALYLWGIIPSYSQVVVLTFLGGVLGVAAMVPLRRLLIVDSANELPYPEGQACAEVLHATQDRVPGGVWIFRGLAVGIMVKLGLDLGALIPDDVSFALPGLPSAEVGISVTPALLAVGYIIGHRQSGVLVSGSLVAALVLTPLIAMVGGGLAAPLAPATEAPIAAMSASSIWSNYVRYIGAGAVATAGILTVIIGLPAIASALAAVIRGVRAKGLAAGGASRDRDLSGRIVVFAIGAVIAVVAFIPSAIGVDLTATQRLVCGAAVGGFGVAFVAVMARIAGIVGTSSQPTSGITIVTLLCTGALFAAAGWTMLEAKVAVLCVGAIVAIAASSSGDTAQDLKTGNLLGATPARQQLGQLIGAATSCWAVAATVLFLGSAYTFGSKELPAPQATLIATIIEGVLQGSLPWSWLLCGAGMAVAVMLAGLNGLAFAIGLYLPLPDMLPIFVGGLVRLAVERRQAGRARADSDPDGQRRAVDGGVLAASGLVAGEGLAGVAVAGLAGGLGLRGGAVLIGGHLGDILCLVVIALLVAFLWRAGRGARG